MYLNYLEKNEKVAFLKIAHIVALSDGHFCENEKVIISSYCNEMEMNDIELNIQHDSLDNLSNEFKNQQSKKIVILVKNFPLMNSILKMLKYGLKHL